MKQGLHLITALEIDSVYQMPCYNAYVYHKCDIIFEDRSQLALIRNPLETYFDYVSIVMVNNQVTPLNILFITVIHVTLWQVSFEGENFYKFHPWLVLHKIIMAKTPPH